MITLLDYFTDLTDRRVERTKVNKLEYIRAMQFVQSSAEPKDGMKLIANSDSYDYSCGIVAFMVESSKGTANYDAFGL